jgi:hypothetical protein
MAYRVGMPTVIIGLALLAFWLYCLLDAVTTPGTEVRTLPKVLWILVVVVFAGLGGLMWLLLGRPQRAMEAVQGRTGMVNSPDRRPRPEAPRGPDDDPDFIRDLERRLRDED